MKFSKEERGMWLKDWKQSGKSAWVYTKENGLDQQTFIRWTKAAASKLCFVEVSMWITTQTMNAPGMVR